MNKFFSVLILSLCAAQSLASQKVGIAECAAIATDSDRLSCFDRLAENLQLEGTNSFPLVSSQSEAIEDQNEELEQFARDNPWSLSNLKSDDPNYFGISWDPTHKNRGVETHVEFDISVKYPLIKFSNHSRFLAIYNGSYDFQALTSGETYESSPVISTTQNPGGVMEWDIGDGSRKFRAGIFHHSNGQTIGESDDPVKTAAAVAEIRDLQDRFGEAPALERISRSSWYAQLRYQWMSNPSGRIDNEWSQFQLELRPFYFWNEDKVFWTDPPSHSPQIENVDGIRAVVEKMVPLDTIIPLQKLSSFLPVQGLARLELQTGLWSPFENVGGKVSLGISINNFLVSGYYYSGFAKDIASYHRRTKHMGIGIELR